jgi:hypothetical protein
VRAQLLSSTVGVLGNADLRETQRDM